MEPGTHMDNGLMYCVYQNQGQGPITFELNPVVGFKSAINEVDRFNNLLSMKNFRYRFLINYESCKVEIWYTHGQWVVVSCLPEPGPRAYNSWSYVSRYV